MHSWHMMHGIASVLAPLVLIREPKANLSDNQRTPFRYPLPLSKCWLTFHFVDGVHFHSFVYIELILRETLRYPDIKHQRYHLGHGTPADQSSGTEANIAESG